MTTEIRDKKAKDIEYAAIQSKSGLDMPITRIKSDVKKISGCSRMSADASVEFAAVLEYITGDIAKHAQAGRKKTRCSIAPESVVEYVMDNADYSTVIGPRAVFVLRKRKTRTNKKSVPAIPVSDVVE